MLSQFARTELAAAFRARLDNLLAPAEASAQAVGLGEHKGGLQRVVAVRAGDGGGSFFKFPDGLREPVAAEALLVPQLLDVAQATLLDFPYPYSMQSDKPLLLPMVSIERRPAANS